MVMVTSPDPPYLSSLLHAAAGYVVIAGCHVIVTGDGRHCFTAVTVMSASRAPFNIMAGTVITL